MIKWVISGILCIGPFIVNCQSSFEGRIKYVIAYEMANEERKGIDLSLPKECKLYTNGKDWRLEQYSALGDNSIMIYHHDADSVYRLMEIGNEKFLLADKAANSAVRVWFEITQDIKSIAGFECHKSIAQVENEKSSVWVCQDYKNLKHLFWPQSEFLPISFTMIKSDLETVYTAIDHSKEPIDDTYFVVSSEYKLISDLKYQRMLR
ncbi:MAG: hypothetical protein R2813_07465 [Flavobacteriales bacterium]